MLKNNLHLGCCVTEIGILLDTTGFPSHTHKWTKQTKQNTNTIEAKAVTYGFRAAWCHGPCRRNHDMEKASNALKRSDLYMNKIVSVIMSSLVMSL